MHRQNGFGAVQLFLVLVVVSIIGFTGWFVWRTNQSSNNAYKKSAAVSQTSGASTVLKKLGAICVIAGDKKGRTFISKYGYSVCLPDGWELFASLSPSDTMKTEDIIGDDLVYNSSKPPTIQKTEGKDGYFDFSLFYTDDMKSYPLESEGKNIGTLTATNIKAAIYESTSNSSGFVDDTNYNVKVRQYVFVKGGAKLLITSANVDGKNQNVDLIEAIAKTVSW